MKDRLNRINPPSLDKRIDPKNLDFLIKEELKDIDHSMKFSYSVFDLKMKSYIIHNGNFVVTLGENEKSSAAEIDPAQFPKESTYEVELFNSIVGSSGILKLSFPTKQKWLWKSVWPILSLSILLISLILACFSYVIYVVFRQKKLSEINLKSGGDVVLTFSGVNYPVVFGRGNESKKMIYLSLVWERINNLKASFQNTEYIDLRFTNEAYIGSKENTGLI